MNHSEWLSERKNGVGGSDVAAILGISKFKTPLDVFLDKTSKDSNDISTPLMRMGLLMEPVIQKLYEERTGEKLIKHDKIIKKGFMFASLDGMTESGKVLEIKNCRRADGWGEEGTDEIPVYYITQVQHYMYVTGLKKADVAVLIGGSDFRIYHVDADEELQKTILSKVAKFWEDTKNGIQPKPINNDDILKLYPCALKEPILADENLVKKIEAIKRLDYQAKTLTKEIEAIKTDVKKIIGCHDGVIADDKCLVSFKNSKARKTTNWLNVQTELNSVYPEAANIIMKNTEEKIGSRRFLIK